MPKVLIQADVEDYAKWEEGFRSHGKLFKEQTIHKPIYFTETSANQVACVFEPEDLDAYLKILDSPATTA